MHEHASVASSVLARWEARLSLYFPFLVYYHIAYYKSTLFPLPEVALLAQAGLPSGDTSVAEAESLLGTLTMRALLALAAAAADPQGIEGQAGSLLARHNMDSWLVRLDWVRVSQSRWPLFGALAKLREMLPPPPPACSATGRVFLERVSQALKADIAVSSAASLSFLEEGAGTDLPACSMVDVLLPVVAHLAIADALRTHETLQAVVVRQMRRSQALAAELFSRENHTAFGLAALASVPGGVQMLWLLDRIQCRAEATVSIPAGLSWLGAENVGMRSDVGISYRIRVFPHRELVSDFLRSRSVPYCNESILRVIQRLAQRLHKEGAREVRIVEVGSNLGDCVLWAVRRFQAIPGLHKVEAVAVEASPQAATLLQQSVRINQLEGVVRVINAAVVAPSPQRRPASSVLLLAKPRSSNSFTPASAGEAAQSLGGTVLSIASSTLDELLPFSSIDLLISHTNGQELNVLRGARRLLSGARAAAVILQLYGPEAGVVRDPAYNPSRPVLWLAQHNYDVTVASRPGRALHSRGGLRSYFRAPGAQQVLNVLGLPRVRRRRRALLAASNRTPPTENFTEDCLDLVSGQRPNSWAEVDGRILRENLHLVRTTLGLNHPDGTSSTNCPPIGAVLKANGYGHGAVLTGRVLSVGHIDALFVSEVETALQLRLAPEVSPSLPIVLLYRAPENVAIACALADANITASVLSVAWVEQARGWPPCNAPLRLHLMIDTGLSREGVSTQEVLAAAAAITDMWPRWSLDGVYTHWCCPYDPPSMVQAHRAFDAATLELAGMRSWNGLAAPFTIHAMSSSTALYGVDYDLLRLGGLLFGDLTELVDPIGRRFPMQGPHRTLLWKSRLAELHPIKPGSRYARCMETSGCLEGPMLPEDWAGAFIGVVPVGGAEFKHDTVRTVSKRERLPLIEKSTDSLVVLIPAGTQAHEEAHVGMEVLLCERSCVQGLFNVPQHVPRLLVFDPSIRITRHCSSSAAHVPRVAEL